jgi:death-on-curing protein
VTVRYPSLEDHLHIAAFVLGLPVETVVKTVRFDLAESALHAPQASWGGMELYPSFAMKAAVLLVRLTKNPRTAGRQQAHRAGHHDRVLRRERVRLGPAGRGPPGW